MSDPGKLVIISGPSGVGKSTVVARLIAECPLPLKLSISATTRPIRCGDKPGENYIFISNREFQQRIKNGDFLEYVEVFGRGFWYGTLRAPVIAGLEVGDWMILEIDVEGAQKIRETRPDTLSIFIHPGSLNELERRLRGRLTESNHEIERRLEVASHELEAAVVYDHVVINKSVERTARTICDLLVDNSGVRVSNG